MKLEERREKRNKYQREVIKKFSESLGTIKCPKCGKKGSLKRRTQLNTNTGNKFFFFQVDHYKTSFHGSGYSRSCYIGVKYE